MTSSYDPTVNPQVSQATQDTGMTSGQHDTTGDNVSDYSSNFLPLGTSRPYTHPTGRPTLPEENADTERYHYPSIDTAHTEYTHQANFSQGTQNTVPAFASTAAPQSYQGYEAHGHRHPKGHYGQTAASHPSAGRYGKPSNYQGASYPAPVPTHHYGYESNGYPPDANFYAQENPRQETSRHTANHHSSTHIPHGNAPQTTTPELGGLSGYTTHDGQPSDAGFHGASGYRPYPSSSSYDTGTAQGYPQGYGGGNTYYDKRSSHRAYTPVHQASSYMPPSPSHEAHAMSGPYGASQVTPSGQAGMPNPATSIQPVFNLLVEVGREHEDKALIIENVQSKVLQWVRDQQCRLPAVAYQGESFQVNYAAFGGSECEAIMEPPYWALQFIQDDAQVPQRKWVTQVVLDEHIEEESTHVLMSLSQYVCKGGHMTPVKHRQMPHFLRQLSQELGLFDGVVRFRPSPWIVGDDIAFDQFQRFLLSTERTLPVLVMTYDRDARTPLLDPEFLHHYLLGIAHVVVLQPQVTYLLSNLLGKELSVFHGALRWYNPQLKLSDDPLRHKLLLNQSIRQRVMHPYTGHVDANLQREFEIELVERACTMVTGLLRHSPSLTLYSSVKKYQQQHQQTRNLQEKTVKTQEGLEDLPSLLERITSLEEENARLRQALPLFK